MQLLLTCYFLQFTSKERRLVDTLRLKFLFINVVFYICWLPNLVNGILLWTMWFDTPVKVVIVLWYIMVGIFEINQFIVCLE